MGERSGGNRPGNRNAPVGCPPSGIESACNGDWVRSMDPQGASGQTALLHKAEMSFNRRSPVGYLTRSKNSLPVFGCSFPAIGSNPEGHGQVKRSSGSLKTDGALAQGRDTLQLKVTPRKSIIFNMGRPRITMATPPPAVGGCRTACYCRRCHRGQRGKAPWPASSSMRLPLAKLGHHHAAFCAGTKH